MSPKLPVPGARFADRSTGDVRRPREGRRATQSRRGKADARDSPEQDTFNRTRSPSDDALEPGDEGDFMEFDEEDDEDWDEESFAMRFEDDEFQESASVRPPPGLEEFEEDWDDLDEGFGMPFSEEDDGATEGDENRETSGFVGSVFDGMDAPAGAQVTSIPSYEELSLLYDDFPVQGQTVQKEPEKPTPTPEVALKEKEPSRAKRTLEYMEEREYEVIAEGIAVRTLPDERSPRTGEILRQGEKFTAIEAQDGRGNDPRLYLRLPEGRGWVFNDEKIYPGLPSVKLTAQVAAERLAKKPTPVKRPLVAVVGRPNVGKSTLVNRICDVPDVIGGITHDEISVTHDRTYKQAEHTDDCGDTYLFDVVDAGGMVFEDSLETVTFQNEIKFQIDVALREACAAVMVVDGNVGVTSDHLKVAEYLKKTYISKGLRVVLAVAKCDRLESMDIKVYCKAGMDGMARLQDIASTEDSEFHTEYQDFEQLSVHAQAKVSKISCPDSISTRDSNTEHPDLSLSAPLDVTNLRDASEGASPATELSPLRRISWADEDESEVHLLELFAKPG
ncbi:unnamed protein product [Durusdinium trenchii]|uniref:G domain-containing protein n=1 Tax=Durusdinium trenchii TaxID=1381693 RepID=A0ABP0SPJ9_9DINO